MLLPPACALLLCAASSDSHARWPTRGNRPQRGLVRPAAPKALDPRLFDVQEFALANGLKVRLIEDHSLPTVSYYTLFRTGSRNERPGITGIAHLFEHMMFNGARKYGPKEFDRVLEANGGYSNAYTSNDLTVYFEDFPPQALATVVELESDRMRSLAITPETLASEREVVKEERRFRVDNEIAGMVDEELNALLFVAHPYHWPVIGWMGDLGAITREDCVGFFHTYYAPNNAVIWLVGDIDRAKAEALIRGAYADIPSGPPPAPVVNSEPPQKGERRGVVRYPAQAPALAISYHAPAAKDPLVSVLDVVQFALGVGEGSRLIQSLVHEKELAVNVSIDWSWRIDPGSFGVFAELKPGVSPRKVEEAIGEELELIVQKGLPEKELLRAKSLLRAHFLQDISTANGRAHVLGNHEMLLGSWRDALATLEAYGKVSSSDVKEAAKKVFDPTQRAVVTLEPTEPGR